MCNFSGRFRSFFRLLSASRLLHGVTRYCVVAVMALTLLGALSGCINDKEEPEFSLGPGSSLPEFSINLLDGTIFDTSRLSDTDEGNLLLLFFNTGCKDCQRELPEIQRMYEAILLDESLSHDTRLICIAREENESSVRAYWALHNLTMPVSPQPDRKIYNLFATTGIPRVYLVRLPQKMITAAWSPDDISAAAILSQLKATRR